MSQEEHFATLYERYGKKLFRYAFFLTGNRADAEELVQDTLLIRLTLKNAPDNEEAFLLRALRNRSIDLRRKIKRLFFTNEVPEVASSAQFSPLAFDLARALKKLPRRQREAFVLCRIEEHTAEQAAQLLEITASSVKTHLARAEASLQTLLSEK